MVFYDRLSELCRMNGTSITAFALEAGCNRSTPNGWKNGSAPNAETVAKAALRFHVSTDYLLGLTDAPRPEGEMLSARELELLAAFRSCDPMLQAAAIAVLRSMP